MFPLGKAKSSAIQTAKDLTSGGFTNRSFGLSVIRSYLFTDL